MLGDRVALEKSDILADLPPRHFQECYRRHNMPKEKKVSASINQQLLSKWPTGEDLLTKWGLEGFHLFEFVTQGLQPHSRITGKPELSPDIKQKKLDLQRLKMKLNRLEGQNINIKKVPDDFTPSKYPQIAAAFIMIEERKSHYERLEIDIKNFKNKIGKLTKEISKTGYSWADCKMPDSESKAAKIIDLLKKCVYNPENVFGIEKKIKLIKTTQTHEESGETKPITEAFPCNPGTKWEDIKITLTANNKVRIETPQGKGHFTYYKLGMSDGRAGDKPTVLWHLFKIFAKNKGYITGKAGQYYKNLPDTAKRLNRHLKNLFGIDDSIFKCHYKKHKAYITKIIFNDQTYSGKSTCSDDSLKKTLRESRIEDIENNLNLPVHAKYDF